MMSDKQFVSAFSKMLIFLVVLTFVLIFLGAWIGGSIDDKLRAQSQKYTQEVIAKRTEPVGTLNVGEIVQQGSSTPTTSASSTMTTATGDATQVAAVSGNLGKEVYDKACFICHATAVTGAPKPGDVENWAPRIEKGVDTLYTNAITGYEGATGIMPPKGGNLLLSDEDVIAAVDYLVELVQ